MTFDHERLEVGAGIVEGGGVTSTSGAHDHDVAYIHSGDYLDSEQQISLQACRWSAGRLRQATPNADGRDARLSTGTTGTSLYPRPASLQFPNPDELVPEPLFCARLEHRDSAPLSKRQRGRSIRT